MDELVEKQRLLTGYLELLVGHQLPEAEQITPTDPAQRGCQLAFRFSNAHHIQSEMKRHGVQVGSRGSPDGSRCPPGSSRDVGHAVWRWGSVYQCVLLLRTKNMLVAKGISKPEVTCMPSNKGKLALGN